MSLNFTLERADRLLEVLHSTITKTPIPILEVWYHEGREPDGTWEQFPQNGYWGKNDTWYRFKAAFVVPERYAGQYVRCRLITGRENYWNGLNPQFLVRVNGTVKQALDTNHQDFALAFEARPGDVYELDFEAYAGREYDNRSFKELPLRFELMAYCHDVTSENAYYDLLSAKKAAELYPETDYRRIQIENYLTEAMNLLDCRVPGSAEYTASLCAASEYMRREFYEKFCGTENVIANCIGHTHIDVAWLWRVAQTRAKACRSFATELALMEEYPEHLFMSSQPQLYQFVKEDCPEIYEQIQERAKEGRWEVEGAMWLEADCNLTSGESLIRQILHGKRFMKQEFGVDSHILWLPDVFGYSAALPQILSKSGIDTFVTSKIHWSETNHFPYDTFLWKGIDGTELFTQYILCGGENAKLGDGDFYSTYTGMVIPSALAKGWELYQQKAINNELLVTIGYSDGGGGVTREMLEMNRRLGYGIPGTPKTRLTTAAETLERIKKNVAGKKLPKWFGELYLERHRGTYTSMAKNKKYNRRSEFLLQKVEGLAVMGKLLNGDTYPKEKLYQDWTTVLLNQFHDIIPGSSIREVYEDSTEQYEKLLAENNHLAGQQLAHLAGNCKEAGVLVYNPVGACRDGIVEVAGKKLFIKDVPALGWKVIDRDAQIDSAESAMLCATTTHMENQYYAIDLDESGCLIGIYDKNACRQVLTGRANILEAYDDHPRNCDNWEISNYYNEKMWEITDIQSISVHTDDQTAQVRVRRAFLNSTIEQTITIYRNMPGIDCGFTADWHEHHIFLKVAFPVDILSDKAAYEIQYGAVERPTHMNTTWDAAKFEVCAQKWADYSEPGYGVALLNDCKYGYAIHDGVMRLSLIKCGTYPNPEADQGEHAAHCCLLPHNGDWREADIPAIAYAYNCPLEAAMTEGGGALPGSFSLVHATDGNIIISTVKESCDGEDIIIRAYESHGKRTQTMITLGFDTERATEVDMMEQKEIIRLNVAEKQFHVMFKPYEIKTFRISAKKESK